MTKCLIKALKAVDLQKHALVFKSLGYDSAGALANFQSNHFNRLNLNEAELLRFIALLDVLKDATREGKICPHYFNSKLKNDVNGANGSEGRTIKAAWTIPTDEPMLNKQSVRVTSSSSSNVGGNKENHKSCKPTYNRWQTINRASTKHKLAFNGTLHNRSKKSNTLQSKQQAWVKTSSQSSSSQINTNRSNDSLKVRQKRSTSSLTSSSNDHNRRSMSAFDVLRLKDQQHAKSSNDDIFVRPFTSPEKFAHPKNNSAQKFFGAKIFLNRPLVEHVKVNGYNYGIPTAKRARSAPYRTFTQQDSVSSSKIFSSNVDGMTTSTLYAKPAEIYVYARKRPLLSTETNFNDGIIVPDQKRMIIAEKKSNLDRSPLLKKTEFQFDQVFGAETSNKQIFDHTLLPFIENTYNRQNMTYICFGQTGSGKSHTMFGTKSMDGLLIFSMQLLLNENSSHSIIYGSFYEIYNNEVYDLCNAGKRLFVREDGEKHVNVINLKETQLDHLDQLRCVIDNGLNRRHHGRSAFNSNSSRSHAVFQLVLKSKKDNRTIFRLVFIDLAGSERAHDAQNNQRQTRREGAQINWSLLALKECIRSMDLVHSHAPFRQSKLTHILRESLVGSNTRTCLMANVSPVEDCCQCSLNTLQYAARIREISIRHRQRLRLNQNYQQKPINHPPLQNFRHEVVHDNDQDKKFKPATASTPVHRQNNVFQSSTDNPLTLIGQGYGDAATSGYASIDVDWKMVDDDSPITGFHLKMNKQQHTKQSNKQPLNYGHQISQEIRKHENEIWMPFSHQSNLIPHTVQTATRGGYESQSSSTMTEQQKPDNYSAIYNKNIQNRAINPSYPAKKLNLQPTDDTTDANPYYSSTGTGTESLGTKISRLAKGPVNKGVKKYIHNRQIEDLHMNDRNYDTTDTEQGVMYSDRPSQATNNDQTGFFTQRDDPLYGLSDVKFNGAYSPNARSVIKPETKYNGSITATTDNKGTSPSCSLPFSALESIAHYTNTHSSPKSSLRSHNSEVYWLDENGMKLMSNVIPLTKTNISPLQQSCHVEMSQHISTSKELNYNESRKQKLSSNARKRNRNKKQIDSDGFDDSDAQILKENRAKSSSPNSWISNKNHYVRHNLLHQKMIDLKKITNWKTQLDDDKQQIRTMKTESSQTDQYNNSFISKSPTSFRQQIQIISEENENIYDRVNQIYSKQQDSDVYPSMLEQTVAGDQNKNQLNSNYTSTNLTNVTQDQTDYSTTVSTTNFGIRVTEQLNALRTLLETRLKEQEDTANHFSSPPKITSTSSSPDDYARACHQSNCQKQSLSDDKLSHTQSQIKSTFSLGHGDNITGKKFTSTLYVNTNAMSTSDDEVDDEVKNYTQNLTLKEQSQLTSIPNHNHQKYSKEVLTDDQAPSSPVLQRYNEIEIDSEYFLQPNYYSLSPLTNLLNPVLPISTTSAATITSNLAANIESNNDTPVVNNLNNGRLIQTSDSERTSQINTLSTNPFIKGSGSSFEQFLTHLTNELHNIDVSIDNKTDENLVYQPHSIQNTIDNLLTNKHDDNRGRKPADNSVDPLFDSGKGSSLFNTNTYSLDALMSTMKNIQNSTNLPATIKNEDQ
ncbi:unnamed protein product [Didymodactylos carnosus]|uniref:Kinesin motor domain-containing protein n=1 Tax=Didymodactylos carnosus TaxID=1234261 RepID=A0A8S2CYY8_9BILA|nr:unnamed protein product [Didymodactylos carnosus]CAF3589031.1 unnamed protein product [Didymodactylos carnosus]